MTIQISDVLRRIVYAGNSTTGPFSFSFEIINEDNISVHVNSTLLALTTDYTVTINADGTGSVTLVLGGQLSTAPTSSDTIAIVGDKGIERQTDFTTGGDLFANTLNDEFDYQTIFAQQNADGVLRSVRAPVTDPTNIDMELPGKTSRAGRVMSFNATTGNPEAGPLTVNFDTVADNIADINTVSDNIADVNTVADGINGAVYVEKAGDTITGNLTVEGTTTVDYPFTVQTSGGAKFIATEFHASPAKYSTNLYYVSSGTASKVFETRLNGIKVNGNIEVTSTVDGVDVSAIPSTYVAVAGDTMTGKLTLDGDPTSSLHAATKSYVDTIAAAGIHYHTPVRVESPTALTVTYDNGTDGVGATLTNAGTLAAITIDGIALSLNDRVLIYAQTDATQNGIYTVTTVGDGSTAWVLTRATDADSYGASDQDALGEGDAYFVKEGNTGAGELYVMNTSGVITFGTTDITFTQIAETAVYTAGTNISLDGTTFNVDDAFILNTGDTITGDFTLNGGNIVMTGSETVDGRDVSVDGAKLDGIEAGADVTDTANVTAAGALMDSEVTNLAQVKAFDSADYATAAQGATADSALQSSDIGVSVQAYSSVLAGTTASFTTADETKLDGIESGATADQTAQEIATAIDDDATAETTLKSALGLGSAAYTESSDYATAAQGTTADSAMQDLVDDTSPQLGGDLDSNGNNVTFGDTDKAIFGVDNDLEISTGSYLSSTWGELHFDNQGYITCDGGSFTIKNGAGVIGSELMASFVPNGAAYLYYDNNSKFETSDTGVTVTGTAATDGVTVDGVDTRAHAMVMANLFG